MPRKKARLGIQSVEVAAAILEAFLEGNHPIPLKEVANRARMHPGKVHRYLVSLTRSGLVEQEVPSGNYGIGAKAIQLGLTGLRSRDVVRYVSDALPALRDEIDETTFLAMWSAGGPVIVRLEESSRPVFMNVRVGSVVPVLSTASGRIFAAFLPAEQTRQLIAAERRAGRDRPEYAADEIVRLLASTRERKLARITGDLLPGVNALAAPVFDHKGRIAAAVGAIGRTQDLDVHFDGPVARVLSRVAAEISARLGCIEVEKK